MLHIDSPTTTSGCFLACDGVRKGGRERKVGSRRKDVGWWLIPDGAAWSLYYHHHYHHHHHHHHYYYYYYYYYCYHYYYYYYYYYYLPVYAGGAERGKSSGMRPMDWFSLSPSPITGDGRWFPGAAMDDT